MQFKLIIAFVKPSITDDVVDAMKEAGATGATIVPARGTGIHEAKTFFGLSIEDQTDITCLPCGRTRCRKPYAGPAAGRKI